MFEEQESVGDLTKHRDLMNVKDLKIHLFYLRKTDLKNVRLIIENYK